MAGVMESVKDVASGQVTPDHSEGGLARPIEKMTAWLPSDTFLWLAGGSIAASLTYR